MICVVANCVELFDGVPFTIKPTKAIKEWSILILVWFCKRVALCQATVLLVLQTPHF